VAGSCEHGDEHSGSEKRGGDSFDQMSDYQLLKNDSAPLELGS
jgi:hypothetical protein